MTIKLCVVLRRSTKYKTLFEFEFFSNCWLCSQSSRARHLQKQPTQAMTSFFQPVKIKQTKRLKLWNVMHDDAKLTWGRIY